MNPLRRSLLAEQTALHISEGIAKGHWAGGLPGVNRLAAELGISRETVRAALKILEDSGQVASAGPGRRRTANSAKRSNIKGKKLRVAILPRWALDKTNADANSTLLTLQASIESAGHACAITRQCQTALRHDVQRISRLVDETAADAWLIYSGTLETLKWFANQPFPTLALGGRACDVPLASAAHDLTSAIESAVNFLLKLGHRRIVLICPGFRRKPTLGASARAFANTLAARGVIADGYHVPEFEESPQGLQEMLKKLFQVTPPTALIITDALYVAGALSFLHRRGLQVKRDVSLVCACVDPVLDWHQPSLARISVNPKLMIKRAVRWIDSVSRGHGDREHKMFSSVFDPGESIGPVRKLG